MKGVGVKSVAVEGFDGLDYTRDALAEELSLVERHARDGSAVTAGCSCIEEKHLLLIAGLASEGVTLAKDQTEKEYYMELAELARQKRLEILNAEWKASGNPRTRDFLPHGLTDCEKDHPNVQKKLAGCIKKAEIKCCGEHTADYGGCECNPVAVCRASVPCP